MILLFLLLLSTVTYDYDGVLHFVWEHSQPQNLVAYYEVWVSKNGGKYKLLTTVKTNEVTFEGEDECFYRVKVRAIGKEGQKSPFSDPSDVITVRIKREFEFSVGVVFGMMHTKRRGGWDCWLKKRGAQRSYRKWFVPDQEMEKFLEWLGEQLKR